MVKGWSQGWADDFLSPPCRLTILRLRPCTQRIKKVSPHGVTSSCLVGVVGRKKEKEKAREVRGNVIPQGKTRHGVVYPLLFESTPDFFPCEYLLAFAGLDLF